MKNLREELLNYGVSLGAEIHDAPRDYTSLIVYNTKKLSAVDIGKDTKKV